MTTVSLRYFATVARRGSIREAAEELHVAQSALSRQIQKLEQEFGVPLFQRHARGVELTSAGEIFLRHARSSLRQTERVRSELDALKEHALHFVGVLLGVHDVTTVTEHEVR